MRRWAALVVGTLLLGGCSTLDDLTARHCPASRALRTQGAADYVDFVRAGGITYFQVDHFGAERAGRALADRDLGPQVAVVRCKLAEHLPDPPLELDGDAAFLDEGTALYAVNGYRPQFRLAARQQGRLVLYEADHSARARTWGDLLDLRGKVRALGVSRPGDPTGREAARIEDPDQLAGLLDQLLASPVGPRTSCGDGGSRLTFHLADGTASVRGYHVHFGRLECGPPLPAEFRAAVRAALRRG